MKLPIFNNDIYMKGHKKIQILNIHLPLQSACSSLPTHTRDYFFNVDDIAVYVPGKNKSQGNTTDSKKRTPMGPGEFIFYYQSWPSPLLMKW